ncbi:PLP-dependent aminotransferase family protein [Pseudoalteromonas luteoviolacea]|uniref:MocR-like pyridoxine biosynthesis transcription factor PdxR n=1 Tax=Pseudoalteromonas luteoviolacea TaxID=43657 RepID=UPI001150ECE0|nr:PLP-dependent aminotransferase family protein [Pseudoalteromonas luteoviolacea]TQF71185.1 PLP-dependent aminotransferase family protein [Pseudoalteromonas luteoviolacea]
MFSGTPLIDSTQQAKYVQLANQIRDAIQTGQLMPGDELPSARQLGLLFEVNRHTVMAAMQNLVAEGWLLSEVRKGYTVNTQLPVIESVKISQQAKVTEPIVPQFAYAVGDIESPSITQYKYNFAGGLPDVCCFPFDEFRRSMNRVCRQANASLLHYQSVAGEHVLKTQLLHYLRAARGLTCDDILVCNGSQEALFLIGQAFVQPGQCVAMEALGYPPARKAFQAAGASIVDIAQDQHGLCADSLAHCLSKNDVKLLYLTPLHQYPTTVTMPVSRRMEIYQLCVKHGVFIIEDDYDHEFHYSCPPLQPMAANDPAQIVIYLATFSKIMFAGARMGYVTASKPVLKQLTALKQIINHKNDVLMQLAIADWMASGNFERHLRRMTKLYRQRCEVMDKSLRGFQAQGYDIQYIKPQGGMAYWVDLKRDVSQLPKKLLQAGINAHTEQNFCHSPRALYTHIRLGFAGQAEQGIEQGLNALFDLL